MLATFTITEQAGYKRYVEGFFQLLSRYGGEFLAAHDDCDVMEGNAALTGRIVPFKFPSDEVARA